MSNAIRAQIQTKSGETLAIRTLQSSDGPRLQRFNAGLGDRSRRLFLPHAYDDATIARVIERAETGVDLIYIALAEDAVVGYFFLWDVRDAVPVLGIGITDGYQDQGIGRQFMQILIEDARNRDRDGIDLTTMQTNDRAFAVYEKCGFRYIEDVDNIDGNGNVIRERWMFLPLKPGVQPVKHEHKPPV